MHKPESVQKNEMHKILWDFEIQTDHLSPTRRPDQEATEKKMIGWDPKTEVGTPSRQRK